MLQCDLVVKQATLLRRDDTMLPSGEAVKTMVFNRMDYISFRASNLDLKGGESQGCWSCRLI